MVTGGWRKTARGGTENYEQVDGAEAFSARKLGHSGTLLAVPVGTATAAAVASDAVHGSSGSPARAARAERAKLSPWRGVRGDSDSGRD